MAAAGIGNPLGLVIVSDLANPQYVGGVARTNLSGGVFAFASTAQAVVSSGLNTYANSDITFVGDASGSQFTGIVAQPAGSNTPVAVLTNGVVIVTASETVNSGQPVVNTGINTVGSLAEASSALKRSTLPIGRALTSSASGTALYAIVQLGL